MKHFHKFKSALGGSLLLWCATVAPVTFAAATKSQPPKPNAVKASAEKSGANAPAIGTAAPTTAKAGTIVGGVLELEWEQLLPKDAKNLNGGAGGPAPIHDYLGEAAPAAQQSADFSVNKELNGIAARLPGFIVPLDVGKDGVVTEFFLVPYFGACIHVPPPPPNQIVYVHAAKGIALDSIYEAYWVSGRMTVQSKSTQLGAAAYQIDADKVEIYKY